MLNADMAKFTAALAELKALKPGPALTKEQFHAWWNHLRERWDLGEFQAACSKLADELDFMPNPYHFEQLRRRASEELAGEAWARVLACVRSGSYRRGVTVGWRADRVVAMMGGYATLGMSNTADVHFREKRFAELWGDVGDTVEARKALPNVSPPMRIGQQMASDPVLGRTRSGGQS